jgi:hypothetical protein
MMDSIEYLGGPSATKDAIERLRYWRQRPLLSNGIKDGNSLAMSRDTVTQLKGFYMIHQSLNKADVELQLLKRLNYVSLWTTIKLLSQEEDKKAVKEAKVSTREPGICLTTGEAQGGARR